MSEIINSHNNSEMPEDYSELLDRSSIERAVRGKYYRKDRDCVVKVFRPDDESSIKVHTFEAQASVTPESYLVVNFPVDLLPGQYRVVMMVEEVLTRS